MDPIVQMLKDNPIQAQPLLDALPVSDLASYAGYIFQYCSPEQWGANVRRVWLEGNKADADKFLQVHYASLELDEHPLEFEPCRMTRPYREIMQKISWEILRNWKQRRGH